MIDLMFLHIIFHFSNCDDLLIGGQIPDGLVILIFNGRDNLGDSVFECSDAGVDEIIGIR